MPAHRSETTLKSGSCLLSGLAIPIAALSGCSAVPFPTTFEERSYSDAEVELIEPGITTRRDVETAFGDPDIVRASSSIAIYGDARRVGGVLGSGEGSGPVYPIETYHLLVVHYAPHDAVRTVDVIRLGGRHDCTRNGICVEARWKPGDSDSPLHDDGGSVLDDAIVFASGERDAVVKRFEVVDDACSVYLYRTKRGFAGQVDVAVLHGASNREPLLIDEDGFQSWRAQPGTVDISASVVRYPQQLARYRRDLQEFAFPCMAGNRYFIDVDIRLGRQEGRSAFILDISVDDDGTGMEAVRTCRLILE